MLNNVPTAINRLARNVVVNHPNSFNCVAVRKRITRVGDSIVGGSPTLGGMGVINNDDEESIEWDLLGNGYALKSEPFGAAPMMDRQDANNGSTDEVRFLIEPEDPGLFEIKKHDVIYLVLGAVRVAYEVIGVESTSDIPPYTQRFVCSKRDDLHLSI